MIVFRPVSRLPRALSPARLRACGRACSRALRIRAAREVGVRFVSEADMRKLNRTYRKINRPTDILSFSQPVTSNLKPQSSKLDTAYLGDLVVCPTYAAREAKRRGLPLAEELCRLLVHGVLHLSGYDHRTEREEHRMFALQERILERVV